MQGPIRSLPISGNLSLWSGLGSQGTDSHHLGGSCLRPGLSAKLSTTVCHPVRLPQQLSGSHSAQALRVEMHRTMGTRPCGDGRAMSAAAWPASYQARMSAISPARCARIKMEPEQQAAAGLAPSLLHPQRREAPGET